MPKNTLKPKPPAAPQKATKATPAPKKNVLDEILDAFPAESKGPAPVVAVPLGFRVTALYCDPDGKRYKAQGDWLVMTRSGDLAVGHRFSTEAEARAFAATATEA